MELIPCPHCGNELDTNSDSQSCLGNFYLSCMSAECGYTGPIRKTLEDAIAATNTRATDHLLKAMAEALSDLSVRCNRARDILQHGPAKGYWGILDTKEVDAALQKYREHEATDGNP